MPRIEQSFEVTAPADTVYRYLIDASRVANCLPGADLTEVVDERTYKGKVKIKVGPVSVSYNGVASITERDETSRTATLSAEGRETTGPGSAKATAHMSVHDNGDGTSVVTLDTEFTVAGKVAQFGRGLMEDVARRLFAQTADCIKANLEARVEPEPAAFPAATEVEGAPAATVAPATGEGAATPSPQQAPARTVSVPPQKPVNALALLLSVIWARIRALFSRRR